LIKQNNDKIVDLDLCEGQWFIEDHSQLDFEEDDPGNDTENGNDTQCTFVIV
jgi:hypothetical protein